MHRANALFRMLPFLMMLIFLSGCTDRPLLTDATSYSVVITSPEGKTQRIPLQLSWNTNKAVMKKLLLEASFVLSDLKRPVTGRESGKKDLTEKKAEENKKLPQETSTVLLVVNFPTAKPFNLTIDNKPVMVDLTSAQIEVAGKQPGRVVLNQSITLQGIVNPNLLPAYEELMTMINQQSTLLPK